MVGVNLVVVTILKTCRRAYLNGFIYISTSFIVTVGGHFIKPLIYCGCASTLHAGPMEMVVVSRVLHF